MIKIYNTQDLQQIISFLNLSEFVSLSEVIHLSSILFPCISGRREKKTNYFIVQTILKTALALTKDFYIKKEMNWKIRISREIFSDYLCTKQS